MHAESPRAVVPDKSIIGRTAANHAENWPRNPACGWLRARRCDTGDTTVLAVLIQQVFGNDQYLLLRECASL